MKLITTCVLLLLAGQEVFGLRILGIFPVPGKSHLSVTSSVMHALAKKGHDVTMFVPFSTGFNASNYKEIIYDNDVKIEGSIDMMDFISMNFMLKHIMLYKMGIMMTELALNNSQAKSLMNSDEKYDIIIFEQFVTEAFFAYVHKFKCPVVLISTFGTTSEINNIFGNSAPYSYVPCTFQTLSDKMTFAERLQNTLANIFIDTTRKYYYMPQQQALADKYWADTGMTIPSLEEIERQSNFILINSHRAFSTPRPYMANMKDVAGIHLKPSKPLPSDLQQYLDSSKNGVILFSLGSAMKSILLPDAISNRLKEAFKRLPYDVLWKWENDTMANKPKNVRIGKWLPQNDILAHPKLKVFVTHGGISSIMETVYNKVPIVGIPLFGDQTRNILFAQSNRYAESLDLLTMTEDDIYNAIIKVATDPKYRENVKKVSAYWRDEMPHPLDEAVYWVEYVAKHDGARHLKAAVTEQNFIQYFLLDVGAAILVVLVSAYLVMRATFRMLLKKFSTVKKSKKTD